MAKKYIEADEFWNRLISVSENDWVGFDTIDEVLSGMPDIDYEIINDAHNEGYDVGYWAGRLDYEPRWIPVTERLPETTDPVNITWVNRKPSGYNEHIKDKPFVATGHYCNGRWYWFSAVCQDYLNEYGDCRIDRIDSAIEVIAWMPLPEPYKEGEQNG